MEILKLNPYFGIDSVTVEDKTFVIIYIIISHGKYYLPYDDDRTD